MVLPLDDILRGESSRVEWKVSDKDTGELLQAVCALANDLENSAQTGYVVLGVDKQGTARGLAYRGAARDEAQQAIGSKLSSTKLLPHPSAQVHEVDRDGALLFVLEVSPIPVPPVVKVDGVAWVRVGTQTRRARDADLALLMERRPEHSRPFDLRPVRSARLDDLDLSPLQRARAAESANAVEPETFPDFERWMTQRELGGRTGDAWVPNVTALLLHGISPQTFLPGAYIDLARYAGTDFDASVTLRKAATGSLPTQLDTLWALFAGLNADVPGEEDGVRTPYGPEYPLEAVKELVRNMVQHRSYEATNAPGRIAWFDDRIVFNNPGGPFGQAGIGRLGDHSDYRNPTLTRGLAELGYVERLGRGIRRVEAILARAGHPALEFETDGFTTVTLRRRP